MKQVKKMLCLLLVMILAFSTVSLGVEAAYTSYASPVGYNLHEEPTYTTAQRASQLLDYIDERLYEMRDDLYIDAVVVTLDFTSVDKAFDTLASLEASADIIGGDIKKIYFDAIPTTRRGTAGKTDLNVLYERLYYLYTNRSIIGDYIRGDLDLGVLGAFYDADIDLYHDFMDNLYWTFVDESAYEAPSGWTADSIIQHGVDTFLLGGIDVNGDLKDGILPSMAGKTNITTETVWQLLENVAEAAVKDILAPYIDDELITLFNEYKAKNPSDVWELIDFSELDLGSYVWGKYDTENGVAGEINHFLYTVVNQVWKGDKFWVDGGNDKLEQNISEAIKVLYKELGVVLLPASAEFLPQEEIDAMNFQELVCYVAKQFLQAEMPYIVWEDSMGEKVPLDNIGQLVCYIAYSIIAELPINTDYMTNVEWGMDEYGEDFALEMIADIGAYYINGALPVSCGYGEGIEMLMKKLVDWLLADNNFGGFFKGCGVSSSDSPWQKIDKTLFAILPLHQILGGNATGSYDLIMNKIIGNFFDLNLEGLLSLFYKTDYSLLNNTAPEFVVNIFNRFLNIVFARNTQPAIISTSLTTFDQIIQNSNLALSAERFFSGLYQAGKYEYFWASLLPLINPILIGEPDGITAPSGYAIDTIEELEEYLAVGEAMLEEPDVYETNAYYWNQPEDYKLWRYNKAYEAYADARALADEYYEAEDPSEYTAETFANAAYRIDYYMEKTLYDQNIAATCHLRYIIYTIEFAKDYDESNYPADVWENYETALDHAYEVVDIPTEDGSGAANPELKQSMVNSARRNLMDAMRLLEVDLADLTVLIDKLAEAKNVNTEGKTEEAVAHLNELIAEAEEFVAGSWTIDYQDEIDQLVEDLQEAIDNLDSIPEEPTHIAGAPVREKFIQSTCVSGGSYEEVVYCTCCTPKVELSRTKVTIEKTPHTEVIIPAVAADCTKTGLTAGKKCSVCGTVTVKQETVPAKGHTEATREENRVEATPTQNGSYDKVTYCTVCEKELGRETIKILATGHTPGAAVKENIIDSTCKTEGSYDLVVYCTCCNPKAELSRTTETIAKKPHTEVDVPAKDATCTETGLTAGKKCSVCGEVTLKQETVEKLPHTEESAVTPPTCTDKGYTTYTCTVCGNERVSDYVDANGHTEEVLPAVPADCVNTGLEEGKKCTVCGVVTVEQKVVPALGHKEATKEENRVEATEEADGSYELVTYCTVCEKDLARETIVIPAWSNAKAHIATVISKNKVKTDDIVTVTVKLSTNYYVSNIQLPVLFDATQFEVVGIKTNKNYLTFGDMFTSRNYNFAGRADKDIGFEYTSDADKWNTDSAKAQYGVAYITAAYDGGLGNDDMTFAKPQGDVVATFQLKALKDVEDTSKSVFVSTDWAKTADNKRGYLTVGMIVEETYDPTTNTVVNFANVAYTSETIAIAGVTVTGTVTSFNDWVDNSDDVTITFTAEGSDAVYTTTVSGSGAQAYELTEVVAGTYTVTVSKANHATRTYTVEVDEEDLTQDFNIHLLGDITGDGKVNTVDVARANAQANGTYLLTDYALNCVDINGDGKVNTIDVAFINAHARGVRTLWPN